MNATMGPDPASIGQEATEGSGQYAEGSEATGGRSGDLRAEIPDQPDGIDEQSFDLPSPARAAQRVAAFIAEWGDGLIDVADGCPLYARDLEVLQRFVLGAVDSVRGSVSGGVLGV